MFFHFGKEFFLYFYQLTHNQQKYSVSEHMVDPVVLREQVLCWSNGLFLTLEAAKIASIWERLQSGFLDISF